MSEAVADGTGVNDVGVDTKRLRLSSRISGIIFWGAVLTGMIVVAVFIKQSEDDFNEHQNFQTIKLLRVVEGVLAGEAAPTGLSDSKDRLQQAVDAFEDNEKLAGVQVQIGADKVLVGEIPEIHQSKTLQSHFVSDATQGEKLVVTAYFSAAANNIYAARKNLIVFLGIISFAFGLIINRVLQMMLTNPIDQMIETASTYAEGDKSARFDESKDDEFGFLSRFINMALNSSETMHKQLESAVHEQRDAKERAEKTLEELKSTQDRLVQSEKLASLGQLTAGIAHEIKNPLNFINNFSETSVELFSELSETIAPHLEKMGESVREEIGELLEDLSSDLSTIAKHGKRADSIVKNMLMHSRSDGGEAMSTDVNSLVQEACDLAFHGERATDRNFQIEMDMRLQDDLQNINVVPQDVTRVLINLLSNAFYATKKRKISETDESYNPTATVSTKSVGNGIEIRIRDNGTGIPKANLKDLFTPFFTTKPTGQGTGLGLSISHDIIAKQNQGRLEVDSKEGEFTEFVIWLPSNPNDSATS
ncbi:MAG: GHKL domain-containing protein [Sphingomonadales bacterium]|nr:GHKL domain-containing protein [Sphingomonadales bacterium]